MLIKFFQTDSVSMSKEQHFPLYLFHYRFDQVKTLDMIARSKREFHEKFWSTIWCCYRQNFSPLLIHDQRALNDAIRIRRPAKKFKIGHTNDTGWGCTIRVSQMMLCHAIMRAELGNYSMQTLGTSEKYINMLTLINDNIDGVQGALSIQNVARMSLVFERYPGEWHGNKSISLVFSHLNKIYNPIKNFKICLFGDENVFYDKIEKCAHRP